MALKKETSLILIDPKISAPARNFGDLSQSFTSFPTSSRPINFTSGLLDINIPSSLYSLSTLTKSQFRPTMK